VELGGERCDLDGQLVDDVVRIEGAVVRIGGDVAIDRVSGSALTDEP